MSRRARASSDFTAICVDLACRARSAAPSLYRATTTSSPRRRTCSSRRRRCGREHEYTDRGKWMDGWESRRRRARPGARLVPSSASACPGVDPRRRRRHRASSAATTPSRARSRRARADGRSTSRRSSRRDEWIEILPQSRARRATRRTCFAIDRRPALHAPAPHIFPDGGVARLRVHGEVVPDWPRAARARRARSISPRSRTAAASLDVQRHVLRLAAQPIMPGRAREHGRRLGDEAAARSGPRLGDRALAASRATMQRIEVDTHALQGQLPRDAACSRAAVPPARRAGTSAAGWRELLPRTPLQPHTAAPASTTQLVDRRAGHARAAERSFPTAA